MRSSESEEVLYQPSVVAEQRARQGDLRAYANLSELKAMLDSRVWHLEAHGATHLQDDDQLSVLARAQNNETQEQFQQRLQNDVLSCCQALETIAGYRPQMFFWPWGHYSQAAKQTLRRLGLTQFGVRKGVIKPADQRPVLPRIGVSARWRKFCKNCLVFRNPVLRAVRALFSRSPSYLRQLS